MNKFIYWTPRILSILFLIFLALFSLDVISEATGFWQITLGLLMHNVPVLILLLVLIISWKYEIVGGIVFTIAGFYYLTAVLGIAMRAGFQWHYLSSALMIAGPALLIGVLFMIGWFKRKSSK